MTGKRPIGWRVGAYLLARGIHDRTVIERMRIGYAPGAPITPYRIQRTWYRRSPLGYDRGRVATAPADLKLKVPQRVMVPLSAEQVARLWWSFRTARDLGIVALMLLNGLRSREVLALELEDLLFSEAQIRVRGKGARVRLLPLPPETIRLLHCYLKTERPLTKRAGSFRLAERARPRRRHDARRIALPVPPSPLQQRHPASQSPLFPPYLWIGYDSRRRQRARADAPDGTRPYSYHAPLHSTDAAGIFAEYTRAVAQIAKLEPPPLA